MASRLPVLIIAVWALVQTLLLLQDDFWGFVGTGTVAVCWYFVGFYRRDVLGR